MKIRRIIALAAAAGLVFALAACGGGGGKDNATKTPNASGTPAPSATPAADETTGTPQATSTDGTDGEGGTTPADNGVVSPTGISGEQIAFRVQFTVASDPGNLQPLVESEERFGSELDAVVATGAVSFYGDHPFIAVGGTIDAGGAFSATGVGRVVPYRDVEATFQGTISNGQLTGTYAIGSNGALPGGQAITYNVTGTAPPPRTTATPGP